MRLHSVLAGILGAGIILAGCAGLTEETTSPAPTLPPETTPRLPTPRPSPGVTSANSSVTVSDQRAVNSVTVASITLDIPGFVMIHRADANNQPGEIIGAGPAFTGTRRNQVIALSETVRPGDRLFAMLHADVNRDGKAEFPGPDVPLSNPAGDIIMAEFTVTGLVSPTPRSTAVPSPVNN